MKSKSRWILATVVALVGLAAYVGNVLATPATPAPGFVGKTLAMATFGQIDSHIHTVPATWQEMIKTKGQSDLYVQQNTWDPTPERRHYSCRGSCGDSVVLVDEATEPVATVDVAFERCLLSFDEFGRSELEGAMRPLAVVGR